MEGTFINLPLWNACNLRCSFCYNDERRNTKTFYPELSEIIEIALKNRKNTSVINIIWWEPLMYPKIFEFLDYLQSIDYKITIITNWVKLWDELFCEKLSKYNILNITISIHSHSNEIEDKITQRKIGVFDKKIKWYLNAKKYFKSVNINSVITWDNLELFEDNIIHFYVEYNQKMFSLHWIINWDFSSFDNIAVMVDYGKIINWLNSLWNKELSNNLILKIHWIPLCIHINVKNIFYLIREIDSYHLFAINHSSENLLQSKIKNNYIGDKCRKCFAFWKFCFWPWKIYVEKYSYDIFRSLSKDDVISLIRKTNLNRKRINNTFLDVKIP